MITSTLAGGVVPVLAVFVVAQLVKASDVAQHSARPKLV
jgi:hypothetical protein